MDYWIFVNCRQEKNKKLARNMVEKLNNLGLDIPTLDLGSRVIILLSQSRHTKINVEERTVSININIVPFEEEELEEIRSVLQDLGFSTEKNKMERESRIMYQMKIVDDSHKGGLKYKDPVDTPQIR